MLHLLKTESILFPWFARFKRQHFARLSAYRRACSVRACSVSCERPRYRLDRVRTGLWVRPPREIKNTHTSCFRSNIGSAERRLATGPAEAQATRSVRLSERAPGTGCTRWWRVGTWVTQNRSQERSGRERRNRKWHSVFFLRICMFFFNGCNQSFAAFSDEWQASGGKLTVLKYEFHRLHFLQNTKSDQSLLIGKKGLSCVRPAGRTGGFYWRVKYNL